MFVLVATPARPTTKPEFLDMSANFYAALSHPRRERALLTDKVEAVPGVACGKHAAARNLLIERFLKPEHTHVLWLDVDLVAVPPDLIEQLAAVTTTDIVAPHPYVEILNPRKGPSFTNGGWFYDTGAFVQNGHGRDMWKPNLPGLQQMDSVGCCYLVPADAYRQGCRYAPAGGEIEHLSFCRQAREKGWKVWAVESIKVEHAYLPRFGESWH